MKKPINEIVMIAIKNTNDYKQYKDYLETLGYGDYANEETYNEGLKRIKERKKLQELEKNNDNQR